MPDSSNTTADLVQIMPILTICGIACVILLVIAGNEAFRWRLSSAFVPVLSLAGTVGTLGYIVRRLPYANDSMAFAGSVRADSLFAVSSIVLLVSATLSILLAWTYLKNRGLDHGEYYVLLLFSISGAMLMACANDLILLFLGLEVLSFALYVLAGFARTEEKSEESSIKYFLLGAFASAFFLYGIALVYGATQTTNLSGILSVVQAGGATNGMMLAGIGLILVGLGFKAAVVPFHQWTPDVYEGAPTSVTAFMAVGAKAAGFAAFLRVFSVALPGLSPESAKVIAILSALTMVVGNFVAVAQKNIKRMLA